jgi:hypothetical protein
MVLSMCAPRAGCCPAASSKLLSTIPTNMTCLGVWRPDWGLTRYPLHNYILFFPIPLWERAVFLGLTTSRRRLGQGRSKPLEKPGEGFAYFKYPSPYPPPHQGGGNKVRLGSKVVLQGTANPPYVGSIPTPASTF